MQSTASSSSSKANAPSSTNVKRKRTSTNTASVAHAPKMLKHRTENEVSSTAGADTGTVSSESPVVSPKHTSTVEAVARTPDLTSVNVKPPTIGLQTGDIDIVDTDFTLSDDASGARDDLSSSESDSNDSISSGDSSSSGVSDETSSSESDEVPLSKTMTAKRHRSSKSTATLPPPRTLLQQGVQHAAALGKPLVVADEGYSDVIGDVNTHIATFFAVNSASIVEPSAVTMIAADVLTELQMCELERQLPTLPLLKRALPMELDRQRANSYVVQCLYLRNPVTSPFWKLEDELVRSCSGSADQDHKIIAIAQTSGAGKTKVTYDCGMNLARTKGYINISLRVLLGQNELRTTWKKASEVIRHVFNEVGTRLTADDGTEGLAGHRISVYTWLTQWATRLMCIFIMCHARAASLVHTALVANTRWPEVAHHAGEAMIRAQRHDGFDSLVLSEFERQAGLAGRDQAALDTTLKQWKTELRDQFPNSIFFAYDEVTALCRSCCGLFTHRPVEWSSDVQAPSAADLLRWRKEEQSIQASPTGSLYKRCTSLFSVLTCAMEKLLQLNYPQVMLDTAFRVWEDVIASSSPTRVQLSKFAMLQSLPDTSMVKFIEEHFWVILDPHTRAQLLAFRGRPLFFFTDVIPTLTTAFQRYFATQPAAMTSPTSSLDLQEAVHYPIRDVFRDALTRAHATSVTRIANIVKDKLDTRLDGGANNRSIIGMPLSRIELIHKLWVHTRLDGGRCEFQVPMIHELVSLGLISLPNSTNSLLDGSSYDPEEHTIHVDQEPILYAALELQLGRPTSDPNDDIVFKHLLKRLESMLSRRESLKGQLGEQAMAWACIRLAANPSKSILDLAGIAPQILESPSIPDWLRRLRLVATNASNKVTHADKDSELKFVLPTDGIVPKTILFPRESMGPDLLSAGRLDADADLTTQDELSRQAEHVGISIQAKVTTKLSAGDALHSTNPGFFHIGKKKRKLALEHHYVPHPAVTSFFEHYYKSTKRWVRVVFNCLGFAYSIVDAVTRYNGSAPYADTPILLINSDPRMFGSLLHEAFTRACKARNMKKATLTKCVQYCGWADPVDTSNYDSKKRQAQRDKAKMKTKSQLKAEAVAKKQLEEQRTKELNKARMMAMFNSQSGSKAQPMQSGESK